MNDPVEEYFTLKSFFRDVQRAERKIGTVHIYPDDDEKISSCTKCGNYFDTDCDCSSYSDSEEEKFQKFKQIEFFGQLTNELTEVRTGTYQTFCMTGVVENRGNIVHLKVGENESMPILNLDVDKLLSSEFMSVAPYGNILNQETVIDTNVRKAFQCNAENLKFYNMGTKNRPKSEVCVPGFLKGICNNINDKLFRINQVNFLVPYRLNVYGEGGFFKAHVDTPKDAARMIGSLVVCFPTKHTGGELFITHQGETHIVDFSNNTENIQWAAFFSDCKHEVKPVISGNRVTMTFNIMTGDESPDKYDIIPVVPNDFGWGKSLNIINSNITMGPNQKWGFDKLYEKIKSMPNINIGIILSHEYTLTGLNENNLKGIDYKIYQKIKEEGEYECELISAVYDHQYYYYSDYDGDDFESIDDVYLVRPEDWQYYMENKTVPIINCIKDQYSFVAFDGMKYVISERIQESGYTGNETCKGETCYVYFTSALIIKKIN